MARTLYVSYDGLTDPLGQSQIVPYVVGLAQRGYEVHVISFEKSQSVATTREAVSRQLAAHGVAWHPQEYTKRPPIASTVWDILRMRSSAVRLHARHAFDLVHCRSYIASFAGLALKARGVRFLFDMRGFYPDEMVEARSWPQHRASYRAVYSYFKRLESRFVEGADAIVTLTHVGREIVEGWAPLRRRGRPMAVIPCSTDFELFDLAGPSERGSARSSLGFAPDDLVLTYLGSLGGCYMLDEMLDFFVRIQVVHPTARLLLVTPSPPAIALEAARRKGVDESHIVVSAAARTEIPFFLAATDLGLFFIEPTPSKRGSSPTKAGEYFAAGIPVITNARIGDVSDIMNRVDGGIVVNAFDAASFDAAIEQVPALLAASRAGIRTRAKAIFDLEAAVDAYAELYRRTLAIPPVNAR